MVVTSEKSHAEHYRDRLMSHSDAKTVRDFTAGTPRIICPSRSIREAICYHDLGLMGKLTYKFTAWLRKRAD